MSANSPNRRNSSARQVYHKPELFVYGDINRLTEAISRGTGSYDSGAQTTKTKPGR